MEIFGLVNVIEAYNPSVENDTTGRDSIQYAEMGGAGQGSILSVLRKRTNEHAQQLLLDDDGFSLR